MSHDESQDHDFALTNRSRAADGRRKMSHESAYHDGYMKALQDLEEILEKVTAETARMEELRTEIESRIQNARCASGSILAASASGDAGY